MNIKDKIAIGLIIVLILLFGIALNGLAYDIKDKNLDDLAYQAATDASGFISVPATDWANKTISAGNYKMGYYKSGVCMYHSQSNNGNASYKITDVLDFSFDGNGIRLSRNGNPINTNEYTGTLAKALYTAYSTGEQYSEKSWGSSSVKEDVIYAFSQAVQKGGIEATSSFYTNIRSDDKGYFDNTKIDNSYGTSAKNYKSVTKNSQDSMVTIQYENGYTMIGPFNISYSGKGIEKVGVYSDQKSLVAGYGEGIYYSTYYKKIDGIAEKIANNDQGWTNQLSTIPSGTEFYILVLDQDQGFSKGSNLRVTFYQQEMQYYQAKLVLAQNPKAQGQNMGVFAAEQKTYTGEQTFNITKVQTNPIDLTVVKYGTNNVKQPNVKFYLSREAGARVYAMWATKEVGQNGEIIYNGVNFVTDYIDTSRPEIAERYVFETGALGKFIIKDLYESYTYSLQEIHNPNPGYTQIDIKNASLSNGVASVGLSNINSNRKNLVTGIRLNSTQNNILEIIDKSSEEFDIRINKVNTSGKKLPDAEFKIRVKDGNEEIGWLYYDIEEEQWDYNNRFSKSTTWNTAEEDNTKYIVYSKDEGVIKLSNLSPDYEYEIYETKAAKGYYNINTQAKSGSMKVTIDGKTTTMKQSNYKKIDEEDNIWGVNCGTVSYTGDSSVTVKVVNVKSSGGGGRRWRKLNTILIH